MLKSFKKRNFRNIIVNQNRFELKKTKIKRSDSTLHKSVNYITKQPQRKVQCPDVVEVSKSFNFSTASCYVLLQYELAHICFVMFICCFLIRGTVLVFVSTQTCDRLHTIPLTGLVLGTVVYTLRMFYALFSLFLLLFRKKKISQRKIILCTCKCTEDSCTRVIICNV